MPIALIKTIKLGGGIETNECSLFSLARYYIIENIKIISTCQFCTLRRIFNLAMTTTTMHIK